MNLYSMLLALGLASIAHAWTCKSIQLDNQHFDISALEGDHKMASSTETPPSVRHVVYTLNPCGPIAVNKEVEEDDRCPADTRVCKVVSIEKHSAERTVIEVTPYARDDTRNSAIKELANNDAKLEGFQVEIPGAEGAKLSATIQFTCDKDIDVGEPEHYGYDYGGVAKFRWKTKHACSSTNGDTPRRPDQDSDHSAPHKPSSWGLFTWLFLIVFMVIASFLIFTLFLNYNRYGQVGLDFVPAMDSVKDIPYLFKDFASQVVDTVKGSGTGRSGYSAV